MLLKDIEKYTLNEYVNIRFIEREREIISFWIMGSESVWLVLLRRSAKKPIGF